MIKISIIIPVYNVEDFLPKCLDSVINQTYKNIEIIVVNDETPDNSQRIIDEYIIKDSRIVSIIHRKNKGLGGARNTGINRATGDYIFFLDSDDWIVSTTIKILVDEINNNNSDIIKFGRIDKYPLKKEIWLPTHKNKICFDGWNDIVESLKTKNFSPICWTNIYKTRLIQQNNLVFPEKLLFEDFYFTIQTHIYAKKISYIDKPLYYWRKEREGSITFNINDRDIDVCRSIQLVEEFLIKKKKYDILNSSQYHFLIYTWSAGTTIYRYLKTKSDKKKKHEIIKYIVKNKYFRQSLKKVPLYTDIPLNMRLSAFLLEKNIILFKIFYKIFLFIKK